MLIHRLLAGLGSGGTSAGPAGRVLWDSRIELGEKFFHEIIRHPVPLDLNILKAMKRSSLGIDFYLWLTYRTFTVEAPAAAFLAASLPSVRSGSGQGGRQPYRGQLPHGLLARIKENQGGLAGSELCGGQGRTGPFALETRCTSPCGSFSSWSSPQVSFACPESFPGGSRRPRRGLLSWVSKTDRF